MERYGQPAPLPPSQHAASCAFIFPVVPFIEMNDAVTPKVSLVISPSYSVSPL
ncbi:MAG TPA: hypothetical protein VMF65_13540 [Acidimicrobiales bacterium]|nr:hypothetical protein [Acidimicrobiales bacterium]